MGKNCFYDLHWRCFCVISLIITFFLLAIPSRVFTSPEKIYLLDDLFLIGWSARCLIGIVHLFWCPYLKSRWFSWESMAFLFTFVYSPALLYTWLARNGRFDHFFQEKKWNLKWIIHGLVLFFFGFFCSVFPEQPRFFLSLINSKCVFDFKYINWINNHY